MTTHIRHRRATVAGAALPSLPMEAGELALNLPDIQLFMGTGGSSIPMLGVRAFATTAKYLANDVMVYAGDIYKAKAAVGPKAFTASDWQMITSAGGQLAFFLPDGTVTEPALAFTSDTNTGLYSAGPDALGISAGGVLRATFDTSGLSLGAGMKMDGVGSSSGAWSVGPDSSSGGLRLDAQQASAATMELNTIHDDGVGAASIRMFRNTTTTGTRTFQVFRGDGSSIYDHALASGASGLVAQFARNGGRTIIGTTADDAISTLQVAGAIRQNGTLYGTLGVREGGSYGGGGPNTSADGIVIDANTSTGISILTPNTMNANICIGDSDNASMGLIQYVHSTDTFLLAIAGSVRVTMTATGVAFGSPTTAPAGSAAAPSYAFAGRLDQGLWSPSSTQVGISAAGADVARFQNVGGTDIRIWTNSATALWNLTGRSQIEINGSSSALLGLNVAGVPVAAVTASVASLTLHTPAATATPIIFSPGAVDRGRFTNAAQAEFLVGATTALSSTGGRGNVTINGSTNSIAAFGIGGTLVGYVFGQAASMTVSSEVSGGSVNLAVLGAAKLTATATTLMDAINNQEIGWRDIPPSAPKTTPYTLTLADRGTLVVAGAGCTTITAPVLAVGATISIFNSTGGNLSLAGSGITLRWGTGSVLGAPRTIANWAIVTLVYTTASAVKLLGEGVS